MASIVILSIFTLLLIYFFKLWHGFFRNLAAAKSSGIPYIIVPVSLLNPVWKLSQKIWEPYLRKLPLRLTDPWLDFIFEDWTLKYQYGGFRKAGHDTFLTVSPGGNILISADAAVINQITTRGRDFPKPSKLYQVLNIYGANVVTTEGQIWRKHRKITSVPFNERNNRLVFAESLRQAQAMTNFWIGDKRESLPIHSVADDAMRLSLHVISRAGFGKSLSWPGDEIAREASTQTVEHAKGHDLSYTSALTLLLHNIFFLLLVPKIVLSKNNHPDPMCDLLIRAVGYIPFKRAQSAYQAYIEWGKYLTETLRTKRNEIDTKKLQDGLDLMGTMIEASVAELHDKSQAQHENSGSTQPKLSDSEIIGNSFVFILAGHETVANSIFFSLVYLALRPQSQRRLQDDLDGIFGSRPISNWNFDRDFNRLFSGMCGAVLAEELRLIPPVVDIPKCTAANSPPVPLIINSIKRHVPPDTYIAVSATCVHRNPMYWPTGSPASLADPAHPKSCLDNDLEEFKPERWLLEQSTSSGSQRDSFLIDEALINDSTPDTSAALFRPARGAYIPFSDGQRACLGRRFAQVEALTVLAVIFKEYSVELAVEDFHMDKKGIEKTKNSAGIEETGETDLREMWEQAAAQVRRRLKEDMVSLITTQLRDRKIPLRLVRRGRERFWY